MTLNIGRKGWIGAAFESSYNAPANIVDYIPFTDNSIFGMSAKLNNEAAYAKREKVNSSVIGTQWSEGDLSTYIDPKFIGYLLIGVLGTDTPTNPSGAVYLHNITVNESSTPKSLSLVQDRATDRQLITGAVVKNIQIDVSNGLATAKAHILGQLPITSTSGSFTSASGNIYSFKDGFQAFGATVAAAQAAANVKPSTFSLTIENNSTPNFRHGNASPDTITQGELAVNGQGSVFFENTTDRDAYYRNTKQAMTYQLNGIGIGSGLSDYLQFNLYQTRFDTFTLETGLANYFAEKYNFIAETDTVTGKMIDINLQNLKSAY